MMRTVFFLERASELRFVSRLMIELKDHVVEVVSTDPKILDTTGLDFPLRFLKNKFEAYKYFVLLNSDVLISTAPYLGNSFFKKSLKKRVTYVNVIHSLKSLDISYEKNAFDQFDVILLSAYHQYRELTNQSSNLNQILIPYGSEPIESLKSHRHKNLEKTVLVAPSWNGPLNDVNSLDSIFSALTRSNLKCIFRPHEIFLKKNRQKLFELKKRYSKIDFTDSNLSNSDFIEAEIMISDVSGAAFEYAFGLARPVLFFENKKHPYFEKKKSIHLCFELAIRNKTGQVFNESEIEELPNKIEQMKKVVKDFKLNPEEYLIYSSESQRASVAQRLKSLVADR